MTSNYAILISVTITNIDLELYKKCKRSSES